MRLLNGYVELAWPGLETAGHKGSDAHERDLVPGTEVGLVYSREVRTPSALVWQDDEALGLRAGERVIALRREADLRTVDGVELQAVPTQRVEHITRNGERVRKATPLHPLAAVWREGAWQALGARVVGERIEAEPSSELHVVTSQQDPYWRLLVHSVGPMVQDVEPGDVALVPSDATSCMSWSDASGDHVSVVQADVHGVEL